MVDLCASSIFPTIIGAGRYCICGARSKHLEYFGRGSGALVERSLKGAVHLGGTHITPYIFIQSNLWLCKTYDRSSFLLLPVLSIYRSCERGIKQLIINGRHLPQLDSS